MNKKTIKKDINRLVNSYIIKDTDCEYYESFKSHLVNYVVEKITDADALGAMEQARIDATEKSKPKRIKRFKDFADPCPWEGSDHNRM